MESSIECSKEELDELFKILGNATHNVEQLISQLPITIKGETYLSTENMCERFNISRRALQNYRNNLKVPYTTLAGKILYPLSRIEQILKANYNALDNK